MLNVIVPNLGCRTKSTRLAVQYRDELLVIVGALGERSAVTENNTIGDAHDNLSNAIIVDIINRNSVPVAHVNTRRSGFDIVLILAVRTHANFPEELAISSVGFEALLRPVPVDKVIILSICIKVAHPNVLDPVPRSDRYAHNRLLYAIRSQSEAAAGRRLLFPIHDGPYPVPVRQEQICS